MENNLKPLYQIHLTPKNINLYDFLIKCNELNIKAVMVSNIYDKYNINTKDYEEEINSDAFTSVVVEDKPFFKMLELARKLENAGIKLKRYKIETQVWNCSEHYLCDNPYFETHFTVICNSKFFVRTLADKLDLKVSQNALHENNKYYLTLRMSITDKDSFEKKVEVCRKVLLDSGVNVVKVMSEAVLHDSDPVHDEIWFNSPCRPIG